MRSIEERVRSVAELAEGDLAAVSFRQLLFAYAVRRRTATLELTNGQIWKRVAFDAGAPVECRSNLLHDTFGRFMVERGGITEDQYQKCLAEKVRTGRRMGEVMIDRGLVSASDLYRSLQQNLATRLLDCFLWKRGTFRVRETTEPSESALRVNSTQLLYTAVTKLTPEAELRAAIGPYLGKTLVINPDPPLSHKDLRLKPADRSIAVAFHGGQTIDEVAKSTGVSPEAVMRVAFGLIEVGLVAPEEAVIKVAHADQQEALTDDLADLPPPDGVEEAAPAAAPAATAAAAQALRENLMRVYLAHRKMDAFELLGLDERADDRAVEQAYLERAWRFAPQRFAAAGLNDLGDKAGQLALAAARAFAQLATPAARATAISRRRQRVDAATGTAVRKEPAELLDAGLLFRKGKRFLELGSIDSALEQLQLASECEPQNAAYKAELAWARYLSSPGSAALGSLTSLKQVIDQLDSRCGVAYLYQGQIHAALGHGRDALGSLQMASRLLRDDPRVSEALRDLEGQGVAVPGKRKSVLGRLRR